MRASIIRVVAEVGEDITQTPSKFWPEPYEIIYGSFASLLIFGLLWKYAWPLAKAAMEARTAKIQAELDAAEAARSAADSEAEQIRAAKGDIGAERARILAEAETQVASMKADGAARLTAEIADLEMRADADIVASSGRVVAEVRAEIARLSSAAVDHVVTGSLDAATHQELIESFIAGVGAST